MTRNSFPVEVTFEIEAILNSLPIETFLGAH